MARCQGRVTSHVLFLRPTELDTDWSKTDLWASAAAVPDVEVTPDEDGNEARRFGAETSGHTVLYSGDGSLLFSGGITASRGHSGDNFGRSAIVSSLIGATSEISAFSEPAESCVFGCPLFQKRSALRVGSDG
jgi:hypothetical protein